MTNVAGADLVLAVPGPAPDAVASVIKLEFDCPPVVEQAAPTQDAAGVIALPASLAAIINAYGANATLMGSGQTAYIGGWDRADTELTWEFLAQRPGAFTLEADVAVSGPVSIGITSGKNSAQAGLAATGGVQDYRVVDLGKIIIEGAGAQSLDIKSLGKDWSEVRLRGVRLVPIH
jgi:hypothetical protein